jgi:hypothetical protein
MNTLKAYFLSLSMITIISSPLLITSNPPSLRDLTATTFIKTILNRSLGESLSQVAPDKVTCDVIELLRRALIQRYMEFSRAIDLYEIPYTPYDTFNY